MAGRDFGTGAARDLVKRTIADLEKVTSAEIVVAIHPSSGNYRHADYLVGFGLSFVSLLVFVFHPRVMRSELFPLEHVFAFIVGAAATRYLAPLRRMLISHRLLTENVERAAKAAFVDLGVSRTRARTGVLVYVSFFERCVFVVADGGVPEPETILSRLRVDAGEAVRHADLDGFVAALAALGPSLAEALPRGADDENELRDEVGAA
jgi:putative membrane protein